MISKYWLKPGRLMACAPLSLLPAEVFRSKEQGNCLFVCSFYWCLLLLLRCTTHESHTSILAMLCLGFVFYTKQFILHTVYRNIVQGCCKKQILLTAVHIQLTSLHWQRSLSVLAKLMQALCTTNWSCYIFMRKRSEIIVKITLGLIKITLSKIFFFKQVGTYLMGF